MSVGLALGLCAFQARAQPQPSAAVPAASAASRATPVRAPGASVARQAVKPSTRPLWSELTEAQRQALAPLSAKWDGVSEAQKRKWIAMSQNFPKMPPAEQAKLHSRMTEWVALSPQQRTQARLNFGKTQEISADDKKAKWEAYQALPPEEKRKLAAGAASSAKPPTTAAAVKPVPAEKLAKVPQPKPVSRPPRIAAGANQVDQNTLLPQPAAGAAN
ncbi:DUF3106 domain-containing protein [Caenimonas sp. DR4.4]|uniref:DUF3106 domain-containing protein n=2 Tax=Caenimonas aquaedulcis TaxID=2793270 RepID=A0A931MF95_9BURK|nr:DUF3106 domain-containing protein [Caenimonas aquaedulcis]